MTMTMTTTTTTTTTVLAEQGRDKLIADTNRAAAQAGASGVGGMATTGAAQAAGLAEMAMTQAQMGLGCRPPPFFFHPSSTPSIRPSLPARRFFPSEGPDRRLVCGSWDITYMQGLAAQAAAPALAMARSMF